MDDESISVPYRTQARWKNKNAKKSLEPVLDLAAVEDTDNVVHEEYPVPTVPDGNIISMTYLLYINYGEKSLYVIITCSLGSPEIFFSL